MPDLVTEELPHDVIGNGAWILYLLMNGNGTWDQLCDRFAYADPADLELNTTTMAIRDKLVAMRDVGLITFEEVGDGGHPAGEISVTDLWQKVRVALGGMKLSEAALISRQADGLAVVPVFGRPRPPKKKLDIFVLMPFDAELSKLYTHHIKKLCEKLDLTIGRADEIHLPGKPFMDKVWDGICSADLILADCTERNPNVFYEIGMAHTVGKTVAFITSSDDDIPSDIKHFDYIQYVYDPQGADALLDELGALLKTHFDK